MQGKPKMSILMWESPSVLHPAARNPRKHSASQIKSIADSIRAYGFNAPVLATDDGEIIVGEARWRAAHELNLESVPVVRIQHLKPAQIEAYRIADNRLALAASWDDGLLASILSDLEKLGENLAPIGFTDSELVRLLSKLEPDAPDSSKGLRPPRVAITQLGDMWQLGEHRLICGDATDAKVMARLLEGEQRQASVAHLVMTDPPYGMSYDGGRARADLILTDPPYGMSFGKGKEAGTTAKGAKVKAHGMILNDDAQGAALVDLVGKALANARAHARENAAFYVCLTWRTYADFLNALAMADLNLAACIVWDKGSIGLGHQHYRPQHEFIFYCRGDAWYGGKSESDVWRMGRDNLTDYEHPTQKPTLLFERMIANSSARGDVVLDCFGGSGSSLIAAEKLGRKARLIELDPKYCDVIVARWEKVTGKKAKKIT